MNLFSGVDFKNYLRKYLVKKGKIIFILYTLDRDIPKTIATNFEAEIWRNCLILSKENFKLPKTFQQ